jgi:hypothetical protein
MPQQPRERARNNGSVDVLISELEQGLAIDRDRLDDALLQHADLFYRAAKELAETKSRVDVLKQVRDETEAVADREIRRRHNNDGSGKLTETMVESAKSLVPEVARAHNDLHTAELAAGKLGALVEAFRQRSHAMSSLVDLYVAGYFGDATPGRARRDLDDAQVEEIRRRRAATLPRR